MCKIDCRQFNMEACRCTWKIFFHLHQHNDAVAKKQNEIWFFLQEKKMMQEMV